MRRRKAECTPSSFSIRKSLPLTRTSLGAPTIIIIAGHALLYGALYAITHTFSCDFYLCLSIYAIGIEFKVLGSECCEVET